MNSPKRAVILLSLLFIGSLAMIGCAGFRNGSPPTKAEQALFTVTTNQIPTLVTITNPPAAPGQPPTVSIVTSSIPTYSYSPGPAIQSAQGAASLIPGYGSVAGMGIGALAAVWAWFRSAKAGATAATLAQGIETIREFVKALPNGANYDSELTTWLQQHQNEEGTANQVLTILANDVSNPDAKIAAQQVIAAIAALNPSALPPGTAVKP